MAQLSCAHFVFFCRLKGETEAGGSAARGGDSRAGEEAGKVEDVNAVGEIGGFDLQIQSAAFLAVQFCAYSRSQGKIRLYAAAVEIDTRKNLLSVLRQQLSQINAVYVKLSGQAAAIVRADRSPNAFCGLHADLGANGV